MNNFLQFEKDIVKEHAKAITLLKEDQHVDIMKHEKLPTSVIRHVIVNGCKVDFLYPYFFHVSNLIVRYLSIPVCIISLLTVVEVVRNKFAQLLICIALNLHIL